MKFSKLNKTKWLSIIAASAAISSIAFANPVCEQKASTPCPLVKKADRTPASLNDMASPQENAQQAVRVQNLVNRHMIDTENAKQSERNHALYVNKENLMMNHKPAVKYYKANVKSADVDLEQESVSSALPSDDGYELDHAYRPNALVESNIHSYQQEEKYNQTYKKEYVKQFKRNLEDAGYKAVVDQNYVVRDVSGSK